ncbi:MAG TPA: hypothetical protein VFM27_12010 [Acidimicrobiales bacterium]|nr:hypothetical protein [Acidimicrobiales bacterium]
MSDTYKFFLLLHIASVVVAFAPVIVGSVALAPAGGRRRAAVPELGPTGRIVYAGGLILAGLFGILLIVTSDDVWEFSDTWISLAFLVWIAMNGVFHAMVFPARRAARSDRAQLGIAILNILLIVMLWLMIWKPGA